MSQEDRNPVLADSAEAKYVKIRIADQESSVLEYEVRACALMGEIKRDFARRLGIDLSRLRFICDGQLVVDTDTPQELELKDGDMIEVISSYRVVF
ncbi:unnamed protein product [Angiostrongylus costaricensis]|uniref:Small ubiquitin-related modifier n=1 Tax=Angiostrongylus costaricensis TaxID=334426 RepID=A0A0R3PG76_ANGCS|nr:unnamed protein product [Angiostrongylus costaricensis]